jgi:hypothetical protein
LRTTPVIKMPSMLRPIRPMITLRFFISPLPR